MHNVLNLYKCITDSSPVYIECCLLLLARIVYIQTHTTMTMTAANSRSTAKVGTAMTATRNSALGKVGLAVDETGSLEVSLVGLAVDEVSSTHLQLFTSVCPLQYMGLFTSSSSVEEQYHS